MKFTIQITRTEQKFYFNKSSSKFLKQTNEDTNAVLGAK